MSQSTPDPDGPLTRIQVLAAMGITAVILLLVIQGWRLLGAPAMVPLNWSVTNLLLGLGLGLAITLSSGGIYRLWPAYRDSADRYVLMVLQPLIWPDLIWLGLLPGISEELLFRGMLLPAFGLDGAGLVLSSLCFGVMHFSGLQQWPYVVWASVVGAILGASAIATGSLLVPLVAHVLTNILSACVWKLRRSL
ncbi:MAG: CPBP family intramembrane glutamic endopeptidase [Cyanobacteria bacterium P01_A01_bin.135]